MSGTNENSQVRKTACERLITASEVSGLVLVSDLHVDSPGFELHEQ